MKVNVSISKKVGALLDAKQKSVKGLVNVVVNEMKVNSINSEYFQSAFAALYADCDVTNTSAAKESKSERFMRKLESGKSMFEALTKKQKTDSDLFKTLSNKEELFVLLRNSLQCYYDNGQIFAKKRIIAYNCENLTSEQKQAFSAKKTYTKVTIIKDDETKLECYLHLDFSQYVNDDLTVNKAERKQRKQLNGELSESSVVWFDEKNNLCTLVPFDVCTWRMLLPAFTFAYKANKLKASESK